MKEPISIVTILDSLEGIKNRAYTLSIETNVHQVMQLCTLVDDLATAFKNYLELKHRQDFR